MSSGPGATVARGRFTGRTSLDDAPAYAPPIRRDGSQRHPHARLAPAVATVLGPLPAPPALFLWGLSDMATDSCGPDDCSPELTSALWTSWTAPCC